MTLRYIHPDTTFEQAKKAFERYTEGYYNKLTDPCYSERVNHLQASKIVNDDSYTIYLYGILEALSA